MTQKQRIELLLGVLIVMIVAASFAFQIKNPEFIAECSQLC